MDQREIALGDIFRAADGYRLRPKVHSLTFVPAIGAQTSNIAAQFTTGIPLTALVDFLTGIAARVPDRLRSATFAREHLVASADFADSVTDYLFQRAGDQWALMTDRAIMDLRGFLALTYTQLAAVATGLIQPTIYSKNQTAVLARNHLHSVRAELPPSVRDMLHAHADGIAAILEAQILHIIPDFSRPDVPPRPAIGRP